MEIKDILEKDAKDLSAEEQGFLREHKKELDDDQYDKYISVLEDSNDGGGSGDGGDTGVGDDGSDDGGDVGFSFKSKEEFDSAVAGGVAKALETRDAARRKAKADAAKSKAGEEDEDFFPEDYKAPNWNEPAKRIADRVEKRVLSSLEKRQETLKQEREELNKQFDQEIEDLRTSGEPIPAKGTPERKAFEQDLAKIGLKYRGVQNMNDAYDIYKVTKPAKGDDSGDDGDADKTKSPVSNTQKNLAKKISAGKGQKKDTKDLPYSRLSKSTDELLEEAGVLDE